MLVWFTTEKNLLWSIQRSKALKNVKKNEKKKKTIIMNEAESFALRQSFLLLSFLKSEVENVSLELLVGLNSWMLFDLGHSNI